MDYVLLKRQAEVALTLTFYRCLERLFGALVGAVLFYWTTGMFLLKPRENCQ